MQPALVALLTASAAHADWMDHFVIRDDVGVHKAPYLGPVELLVMPVEIAFDVIEAELERRGVEP